MVTRLAPAARPRERLYRLGPRLLSNQELIALVLGQGIRGQDALQVALALEQQFGSIAGLVNAEPEELAQVPGIGPAKAAQLSAALELGRRALSETEVRPRIGCASDVHRLMKPLIVGLTTEIFFVLVLGARHQLLKIIRIAEGGLTSVAVHPREVFRPLLRLGAAAAILVHNHPSNDPSPSNDDLAMTRRLKQVGALTGIPILDHVIVTTTAYTSLAEEDALDLPDI